MRSGLWVVTVGQQRATPPAQRRRTTAAPSPQDRPPPRPGRPRLPGDPGGAARRAPRSRRPLDRGQRRAAGGDARHQGRAPARVPGRRDPLGRSARPPGQDGGAPRAAGRRSVSVSGRRPRRPPRRRPGPPRWRRPRPSPRRGPRATPRPPCRRRPAPRPRAPPARRPPPPAPRWPRRRPRPPARRTIPSATSSSLRSASCRPVAATAAPRARAAAALTTVSTPLRVRVVLREARNAASTGISSRETMAAGHPQLAREAPQEQPLLQVGGAHHADHRPQDVQVIGRGQQLGPLGHVPRPGGGDDAAEAGHPPGDDRGVGAPGDVGHAGRQLRRRDPLQLVGGLQRPPGVGHPGDPHRRLGGGHLALLRGGAGGPGAPRPS